MTPLFFGGRLEIRMMGRLGRGFLGYAVHDGNGMAECAHELTHAWCLRKEAYTHVRTGRHLFCFSGRRA